MASPRLDHRGSPRAAAVFLVSFAMVRNGVGAGRAVTSREFETAPRQTSLRGLLLAGFGLAAPFSFVAAR